MSRNKRIDVENMITSDSDEQIYYKDSLSKVTNVRVTCKHITVPIEKIESVNVNFRIEEFFLSGLLFFSSFAPFLFLGFVSGMVKPVFVAFELIIVVASFLWFAMVCRNYIELVVTVGGRELVILTAHMRGKDHLCKVAKAIEESIFDEKKYQKLKKVVDLEPSATFNSSETMRLKMLLKDYENLKAAKEGLIKTKNG